MYWGLAVALATWYNITILKKCNKCIINVRVVIHL